MLLLLEINSLKEEGQTDELLRLFGEYYQYSPNLTFSIYSPLILRTKQIIFL